MAYTEENQRQLIFLLYSTRWWNQIYQNTATEIGQLVGHDWIPEVSYMETISKVGVPYMTVLLLQGHLCFELSSLSFSFRHYFTAILHFQVLMFKQLRRHVTASWKTKTIQKNIHNLLFFYLIISKLDSTSLKTHILFFLL